MKDLRMALGPLASWWRWTLLCVITLFALGCGGGSLAKAPEAAMAPAPPMEEPEATATGASFSADDAVLYRESEAKPMPARGGMAQATPPGPPAMKKEAPPGVPDAATAGKEQAAVATGSDGKSVAGPLLIYKAQLYMAVFETKKAIDAVEKLAKDNGGYLVSREDTRITVRVPAGKFDGALDEVAKMGDLLHRNVNVQDVTAEYTDLAIRMRNLEVMRERLEELLKKAAKVEEALAVERELERVAGELERIKGRLKLLRELVTFSTITVEFQPRPVDHVDSKVRLPFPWLDRLGLGDLLRL
ncbi:MAG: DUF4349 domain-containing protein [Polyangiaceae bacterium]|nr:DUF4349 domain-containing protein [Polyangiaceae bacterium]MCL4754583.1 DUF4349 domain-containing protein [Myxococcales bacterium]